ncbi:TonB-dependent receptor [Paludibaculum fermentans]|uniref:Carboxypeptidase regulatory-like domain-containing protein n=1 Tax=Paludibaculum fermentans TaxID=1473598 RepID=A0A7S7NS53_PALFE|nr:TonB-dependent receptor [Paludibaculum fermentans]QOY88706.1 carboxypeptidase regulatory-like domain-containing protein [Paludibaculum fermentans]
MRNLAVVIMMFCLGSVLFAQNSGIQGSVIDPTKAVVPNASVRAINLDTSVAAQATTNGQGLYLFPLLPPGRYRVECEASGFAPQKLAEFRLETGQTARLDFELKTGSIAESIEVSASAVLINSETSEVGQVVDSKRILEMPLNGRNYLQLAQFTAGVLPGGGLGVGSRARDEGAFSAVGLQIAQNNVLLDGTDNSSRTSGGPLGYEAQQVKPPVDAVAEFKVVTNNMSAEYGYRAGAKVLVTTKSGSNQFHGSAYEFLRNEKLDGTNFFANRSGAKKPSYRQNQFGTTLGGPVIKNRTFFFGSYQGTRIRTGQSYISTLPSRDIIERGDFSKQPAVRQNIFDPLTQTGTGATAKRSPFAGNIIPQSRWDPVVKNILPLYPTANIGTNDNLTNNYYFGPSDSDDADQYDFRGDHNFSDKHRFFARYSRRDQFRNQNGYLPYPAMGGQGQTVKLNGNNVAGALSSVLTSTLFNEARFGYAQFDTAFDIPFTKNMNKDYGIKNAPGDAIGDGYDQGWSLFSPSGFVEMGPRAFWPNVNNLSNYQVSDAIVWQHGKHTFKFGGELRRSNVFRNAARYRRGQLAFNGQFTSESPNNGTSRANTGNGMADMLLGYVSGGNYGNNQGEDINNWYYGFFVQDDFKISSRLTLNVGIRYEVFKKALFPNSAAQSVSRYLYQGINVANQADEKFVYPTGDSDSGGTNDLNNWAPRIGLAYSANAKTVIRAGAGTFYGEANSLSTENANFRSGPPKSADIALQTTPEATSYYVKDGYPGFSTSVVQKGSAVYVFPDFRPTLYVSQWFLDVQRNLPWDALLTVGYIGTKGTHLHNIRNINLPQTPSATVAANQRYFRPQFGAISLHENSLNSSYNSMTAKVEKRFSKGLTLLSSFTWSHSIDQGNEDLLDGGSGGVTPWDMSRERSNSNLDRRRAFVLNSVYELPFGKNRSYLSSGPAAAVLGGWQVGGIFSMQSGLAIGHSFNVNNQNLGGAVRGDWVKSPNLPSSERTIDRWFDTGFVVASAPGVVSNAGRNLIYAPGRTNLDIMVSRSFNMPREGHYIQFRFESFNFANHANFGSPNTAVGTPNAGKITTAEDPRRIQFALKYAF